jgi:hypothetical protein
MSTLIRRGALVVSVVLLCAVVDVEAWACPVCFRMEDGPVTDGVFAAVLVLLGVTSSVLAGFAVFIHGFVRRLRNGPLSASQDGAPTPEGGNP